MKGFIIKEIIRVIDVELLELYFNIEKEGIKKEISFHFLTADQERTNFSINNGWFQVELFEGDINFPEFIIETDELYKIIGKTIEDVKYGLGKVLNEETVVLYYLLMRVGGFEVLIFNNGADGIVAFDRTEEILARSIYEFTWFDEYDSNIDS